MPALKVKQLESLTAIDNGRRLADGNGVYGIVRAGHSGVGVLFRWRYRSSGKLKDYTLGTWPSKTLAEIRESRRQAEADLKAGRDPGVAKQEERLRKQAEQAENVAAQRTRIAEVQEKLSRQTVQALFERWTSVDLIRRKDGGQEIRRMFEKDVLPTLGALPVEDVRKGHITAVTDALLARGVTRMAKLIFSLIRQMFRFAVDRDIIEFDPTASIRKAKIGGKDTERDRVLSEEEIRALAKQTPAAGLTISAQAAIWIALSTCCRIGELLNARWDHVDLEKGTWWIPPENTKNSKAHTVFLSPFALEKFLQLQEFAGGQLARRRESDPKAKPLPWIYPNRHNNGPVCSKTITKQLGDRQRPGLKPMKGRAKEDKASALVLVGGKWGPHDLRRTGATLMVMLGVLPEVAERCLNHLEQNRVKRTYQRHSYENEMREAWHLLGERIALLTRSDADNVLLLQPCKTAA